MKRQVSLLFIILFALAVAGCKPKSETKASAAPARVITENDLNSIELKPEAAKRLGIETAPVTTRKVARTRHLGGELLLPLGRNADSSKGTQATQQSIYSLLPAMTATELVRVAELQVDADGRVATTQVQIDAARIALSRAENLVANEAGTQRTLDDARAQVGLAEAALQTARERRALLGAPLFDAVRKDVLWVRVPIYAGDLDQVNRTAPGHVSNLRPKAGAAVHIARLVDVPFSAAASTATIDLFYEVDNANGTLRPGQKVTVAVPLQGETESRVIPMSAVLYDIHGGTWVYENTGEHKFTRRRVDVHYAHDTSAVLAHGPQPGANIVIVGAAELFGTEFGIGK